MLQQKKLSFGPGAFRLFLAALVMVHHTFPLRIGSWAVYVFFILSGYWIATMWQKKYSRTATPYLTFLISRWWRLAPVFAACTILGVISTTLLLRGAAPVSGMPNFHDYAWWVRQIFIVGSASAGRVLPPSWSLDVEMQFYIVAPLVIGLLALLPSRAQLGVVLVGFAYLLFHAIKGTDAETPRLDIYVGCFIAGIWLQQSRWQPTRAVAIGSLTAFFVLTFLFMLPSVTRGGIWVRGEDAQSYAAAIPGWPQIWWVLGALMVLPFVAYNVHQPSPLADRRLGNLAYPLYLFHWIARDWYYKYVDWSQPMSHNLLLLAAAWVAAFVGATLILVVIDQPIDRLRARWVAKRERAAEGVLNPALTPASSP